ncbi:MAG: metallophosphoesterase [Clostridia bacterium]|nr:metallophosphoesterase [Clostridia bacterium]
MKRIFRLCSAFFLLFALLAPAGTRAAEDETLRFRPDGSFTILLLADTQDTQFPPAYLLRSIEAVLNNYEIDLVVLLGDQLEGGSPVLRFGSGERNVRRALSYILDPLARAGLPFAAVLGNHDYEAPLSPEAQLAYYRSYENCVMPAADESGAYRLPVLGSEHDGTVLNLYFFESGPDIARGEYGAVSEAQVAWYRETAAALHAGNSSQTTPAVAFQHVIVPEVYELFQEVPADTPGALQRGGRSYLADVSKLLIGEAGEAPCPSGENYGLFDAFVEQGDVFLSMAGHDHVNSFIGSVRGVDIGAAPGSSYTSYGSADMRGVRLLRFYEDDVKSYNTIHVRYADFIETGGLASVRYYLSTTTAVPNAVKTLLLFALVITLIVLVSLYIARAAKRPRPPAPDGGEPEFDDDPGDISAG